MTDGRRAGKLAGAWILFFAATLSAQTGKTLSRDTHALYRPLPAAMAGDWDGIDRKKADPSLPSNLKEDPAYDAADPMIVAHLTPWAKAKREATSYDNAPGSLCDHEGWFPFINYGYGFALLNSPGKITIIPMEPDTEGIRRVYLTGSRSQQLESSWNGSSIAHWEGDTLVIETTGYNALTWLGDDREPHTTGLHMVERMRLVGGGQYLEITYEVADAGALSTPYRLKRYFTRYNAAHLGAGPDRNDIEWVCNEDLSPFTTDSQKSAAEPKK